MRKLNLLLVFFTMLASASMGQFIDKSPLTCFPAPAGTAVTATFNNVPAPAADGMLKLLYQGDTDNNTEYIEVFDENGLLVGTSVPSTIFADQCKPTLDSISFSVTVAQLTSWSADGVISFSITPQSTISTTLCTPCSGGQVELSYPSVTGANDASAVSVDSPLDYCAGSQTVMATIRNTGTNQINTVTVNWELNGVSQTAIVYNSLLDTLGGVGPNTAQVTLGTANFPAGTNSVKVYTSNPNGVADTTNANDTIVVDLRSAPIPRSFSYNNVTLNSVDINSVNPFLGSADYVIVPGGQPIASGTIVNFTSLPHTISGLTPGTAYDLYVRTNCGNNDASGWAGPQSFITSYAVPYVQDFENFGTNTSGTIATEGWSNTTPATPRWQTGSNTTSSGTGPTVDHTIGAGGIFAYLETSGGVLGDDDTLISPPIYVDPSYSTVELGFWYHMHGASMGELEVYADSNGVSTLVTTFIGQQTVNQTDPWVQYKAFLNGYQGKSIKLKFVGIRGGDYTSDASIDDVTLDPVLPINATVTRVLSPSGSLCPGNVTPIVEVRNSGSTTLSNVKVVMNINGTLDSTTYTGTIAPGATTPVSLPSVNVLNGQNYDVTFYSKEPNGLADQLPTDDTLSLFGLRTGLSGVVTVDPGLPASNTNFLTFADLTRVTESYGVCGAVTVNVAPGLYNESIYFDAIPGASSVNTLTIDGGDSASTTISHDGSVNFATLTFDGANYVTVKNVTLEATGSSGNVVILTNGSSYNTVTNCQLFANTSTTSSLVNNVSFSGSATSNSTGAKAHYNTISNNYMLGGYYGFYMYGAANATGLVRGNKILNNQLDSAYQYGLYAYYIDSLEFVGNNVNMLSRGNLGGDGAYVQYGNNTVFNQNNISALDYGVYMYNFSTYASINRKCQIENNMIYSETDYGLYLGYVDSVNLYHNSVNVEGLSSAAVYIVYSTTNSISEYDARNNIFSASNSPALFSNLPATYFTDLDYNIYSTGGANLFTIDGTNYADLAAYVTAQPGFNVNSLEGDPQFASATDLHILGVFANDVGDNLVGVNVDIDGDIRPMSGSTIVDIGADEFDPPSCPPVGNVTMLNPGLDSITVKMDPVGNANGYEYVVVPVDTPITSGTPMVTSLDSLRIGGLSSNTTYDIYIRVDCGRGNSSAWVGPITFSTANGIPFFEDFETFGNNATGIITDKGWLTLGSPTPRWQSGQSTTSSATGPVEDHTIGAGGTFLYLETSGGANGDSDDLFSPSIVLNSSQTAVRLSFWYHMHGATINELEVYVEDGSTSTLITTISGQQQAVQTDAWQEYTTILSGYQGGTIRLKFTGIRGTSYTGDISIDDVALDNVPPLNTGVVSVINPTLPICPGPVVPVIGVKNLGTSVLTSFMLYYNVNGVLDSVPYTGTLNPGDTAAVSIPSVNFISGVSYDVVLYSGRPNNMADMLNDDDTLSLMGLMTGLAGSYTVDAGSPSSATNWQSLTDFANAVNSTGLCGPITVDVVANSGPYNEQIEFDEIVGSSSTNTITINGNGETIAFGSTNTNQRAVITFDGASWMILDGLNIDATGGTYAWGIQNINGAHHIDIRNLSIDVDVASTSTFNVGIVNSGSRTSPTSSGGTMHDISVDNCTIIGGYASITSYGNTGAPDQYNFSITNNTFEDFYQYGTYFLYTDSVIVDGNDFSRPNKTSVTTFYGVYVATSCEKVLVNANAIHNTHGSATSLTGTSYPIYMNSDAVPGAENLVSNNLIYDINSNGTIYGIYDLGADNTNYLHNTISLDHTASTGGTTRGFYQSASSSNSSFVNNIITISRGGTGVKHGIYLNNTATSIVSDHNDVYLNSVGSGASSYGYYTAAQATLADWQANTTYGVNSYDVDPQFRNLSNYDFVPREGQINNAGMANALVSEDYDGVVRGAMPDLGAYEFSPPVSDNLGIVQFITPIVDSDSCYGASEDVIVELINSGGTILDFTTTSATITVNVTGANTQSISTNLNNNNANGGNPLPIGSSITLNIGAIDMSIGGTYNLQGLIVMPTDTFGYNDTLIYDVVLPSTSAGTIAGTDTICSGDTARLSAIASFGSLQWQEFVSGSWVDITGETSNSLKVTPTINSDYRVIACGTAISSSFTVVPLSVQAPSVSNGVTTVQCGSQGTDTLVASSSLIGVTFNWYDAPTGGNLLQTEDTLFFTGTPANTSTPALDTFYVSTATGVGEDSLDAAPFTGGNGCGAGNMFDLEASTNLDVNAFGVNCGLVAGTAETVEVYIKSGTYDGSQTNAAAWTLVGTVNVTSAGPNGVTVVPLLNPIKLSANAVTGVYLNFEADYTNIATGTQYSNSDLTITIGDGLCNPFGGVNTGRGWNGRVFYSGGCESARTMVVGEVTCGLVGLEDNLADADAFSLYPNPSNGEFKLTLSTKTEVDYNMSIRDVQGKLMFEEQLNVNGSFVKDYNFESLPKGVYFMNLQSENESIVRKVIIQ